MSDIELDDRGDCRNRRDGIKSKTVPRMTFDPERFSVLGCLHDALELTVLLCPLSFAKSTGMQFYHGSAQRFGCIELRYIRFDK